MELRDFLAQIEQLDGHLLTVDQPINPAAFELTAVLAKLEQQRRFPAVLFNKCRTVSGDWSPFPVISNIFASRERCALALGLGVEDAGLNLALHYAERAKARLPYEKVPVSSAPVKNVVLQGDDVDLSRLPIVKHHHMDGGPYIDMVNVMRDEASGAYNAAFLRNMYKGPRKLGLHMSPRHNWYIVNENERKGRPTPVAIVVSHHPSFYLGALNLEPFHSCDYEVIGALMGQPLRVTESATWGDRFLIPADAEMVIEGEVLPGVREVEGPFGEFPGTYGPQRIRWVIDVKAINHRRNAIYQDIFVGHRDNWTLGALPKEGSLFRRIQSVIPNVKAVHLPTSGTGRFHCFISLDKRVDGEPKQAAMIALGECDFVKMVVVVDADINPFVEEEVLWAMATRVQADVDVDIIKNIKTVTLDPSLVHDTMGAKMIIDATVPLHRPFAKRSRVPEDVVARVEI